jgi:predicted RNA-binding protein with PIN domain
VLSSPLLVVDAANVIGARPDGWWRDRAGAVQRLIAALAQTAWDDEREVVVVLEGAARPGADVGTVDGVRVVHAPGSGDDAIVDVVATGTGADRVRQVIVVTADRGLRERVRALGADTMGPRALWEHLDRGSSS